MGKTKFVIFLISLIAFFISLNGYAIAQLTEEQLEAFRSAKTVKIVVNQSYGEAKDVNLPFEEVMQSIVKYIGLKKMTSDVKDCDLTIEIKAKGKALSGYYTPGGLAYTGASLSGSISLKAQGVQVYQLSFESKDEPPKVRAIAAISLSKSPSDAPFSSCFNSFLDEGSFIPTIAGIMKEVYGVFWCLNALKDVENRFLVNIARRVLGKTKDPQTVEPLISLLKDKSITFRADSIAEALRMITGQDLGKDHAKWKEWWEKNKEKIIIKERIN